MGKWYEDPIGEEIVRKKYLHEGEKTFEDAAERIAACLAPTAAKAAKSGKGRIAVRVNFAAIKLAALFLVGQ